MLWLLWCYYYYYYKVFVRNIGISTSSSLLRVEVVVVVIAVAALFRSYCLYAGLSCPEHHMNKWCAVCEKSWPPAELRVTLTRVCPMYKILCVQSVFWNSMPPMKLRLYFSLWLIFKYNKMLFIVTLAFSFWWDASVLSFLFLFTTQPRCLHKARFCFVGPTLQGDNRRLRKSVGTKPLTGGQSQAHGTTRRVREKWVLGQMCSGRWSFVFFLVLKRKAEIKVCSWS